MSNFETIIGLEIHLKLLSPNKLFCRCHNVQEFEELQPNTNICPICTGQPGALPVLNKEPLDNAIRLGLALGCHINQESLFDRKSYFYPDLPMGYQITQQWKPTCVDGEMHFWVDKEFSIAKAVRIRDAHIETDTGKTVTEDGKVWLDYNRSASPLVEVVSHPDFRTADEVVAFLKELQRLARYNSISHADMEKGQMRCDVNISLRPEGDEAMRTRVEMKNMNSFSAVRRAIEWEVNRQTAIYNEGGEVSQETRGRDDAKGESYVMRSKEDAMDYRYMPEPDLPPLELDLHHIDELRAAGIESPYRTIERYKQVYAFNKEYINGLIGEISVNRYFERAVSAGSEPAEAAKWIVGPIARFLNENNVFETLHDGDLDEILAFSFDSFVAFVAMIMDGNLMNNHAKIVMNEMLESGKPPLQIVEEKNLKPVDADQIKIWVEEVLGAQPELLGDLKAGNMKPMGFITGQVMKKSGGAADPQVVQEIVRGLL